MSKTKYINSISIDLKLKKNKELKMNNEIVAISHDEGISWKFMIKNEQMTKEILALKFSNTLINQLLEN